MDMEKIIKAYFGSAVSIASRRSAAGGDINRAYLLRLSDGTELFLKENRGVPADFFRAEADGLNAIRETGTINVPRVLAVGSEDQYEAFTQADSTDQPAPDGARRNLRDRKRLTGESFLLLEYIPEGRRSAAALRRLGRGLAALHLADASRFAARTDDRNRPTGTGISAGAAKQSSSGGATGAADQPTAGAADQPTAGADSSAGAARYGFHSEGYIGASPQDNGPAPTWVEFFAEKRLRPQFERASAYWDSGEIRKINAFLDRLDRYLVEPAKPALLHGDLWGGNYMIDREGEPWLIDPAAYVGDPEADLAMTELFGGFGREFYSAYDEVNPIDPGYRDRCDLYNLYHLLNHLNLFGGGYLHSVKNTMDRYL